ncbi:MAG: heparinase II/III family protein [Bacteroidales bacterium]|nr:heparinase II/III family protein [Bacteroidales bacterium]
MKNRLSTIFALCLVLCLFSCKKEDEWTSGGNGGSSVEKVVDNESVDKALFEALDRQNSSLSKAFAHFDKQEYFYAAHAVLDYYRVRTGVSDPAVNLINPQISSAQKALADASLEKKAEELNEDETLSWSEAMGLAYRTSHDEKYAKAWAKSIDSFIDAFDTLYTRGSGMSAERLDKQISSWEYFLQSSSLTPVLASKLLDFIYRDAAALASAPCSALGRAALVFPEFKGASDWAQASRKEQNKDFDKAWFEALNLDFPGMEAVKRAYQDEDYKGAADALKAYWLSRKSAVNPLVDYKNATVTETELHYAQMALKENNYRFYVKNYYENKDALLPYSYLASDGKSINWQYWPTKDQEQRYQVNRHEWMPMQARAYRQSGDERYVEGLMEVFADWMRQNPRPTVDVNFSVYPENLPSDQKNFGWTWRGLETATRLLGHCDIVEYIKDAKCMDSKYLAWYLYTIGEHADFLIKNYSATSNHLITEAQAVAAAGLLLPELKNSSAWTQSGIDKLNNEVKAQYYNDGWLMDGDFHYHISSIEDFRMVNEIAVANGKKDMVTYRDALGKMCDVVLNMTYPDYSSVNMTDTRCATWTRSVLTKNFARYTAMFPDNQAYQWMATGRAQGAKPSHLGANFPDCGYYVLRSGWEVGDIMMVLQNTTQTPSQKWHRQWDNNTFELYVGGRKFFQDSGCYTYTTGTNRSKYAATSAHNTLTLDGKNVTSCKGAMVKSTVKNGTDVLVLSNPSYSALTHTRTVFFVERKFFVIVDEAVGSAAGNVQLHFHLPAGSDSEVVFDAASCSSRTAFADGNNIKVATFSDSSLSAVSQEGFLSTNIDVTTPRKAYHVDIAKDASTQCVRYITVLAPCSDASKVAIEASFSAPYAQNGCQVEVSLDSKKYNLSSL